MQKNYLEALLVFGFLNYFISVTNVNENPLLHFVIYLDPG